MTSPAFQTAAQQYADLGVDVEQALNTLLHTPISVHCWQCDDVRGFEVAGGELGDGLSVTGDYPGRARNIEELRADLEQVTSWVGGNHRLNLHAIYGDFGGKPVDRDEIEPEHFQSWIEWARSQNLGLDFNPSCFSHSKVDLGCTLSSPDADIRAFWVEHCKRCRVIAGEMGKALGSPCVTNIWVPDGMKDLPAHRGGYRERLQESLDQILADKMDTAHIIDSVESKLFGIGSESMVVGSHEFYLGYAIRNQIAYCLDAGHFHPTESLADKISSVLMNVPHLLLHVSRGVRWDSDHVVLVDDPTKAIMQELVRNDGLKKTSIGLDFFDASINRVAAWTIGTRSAQKALLMALLEPHTLLQEAELAGDFTTRLTVLEQLQAMPWGIIWDEFCQRNGAPEEAKLALSYKDYETSVLSKRV